ncbi:hypothetical protein [Actinomadura citrea]|uniref:Restriction endonuclease S subunit n=1 Tax=Actinomadura citrea TaxID=46158 RepID=A0A7Y9G4Z7_9ACTN|nr:hypothetical protein [Actinomadura citrea]NYE10099.1 restriction endonuclease S subunit [Actinomadura citrea]
MARDDFLAFSIPAPTTDRLTLIGLLEALDSKIAVNDRTILTCIELASSLLQHETRTNETTNISLKEAAFWLSGGTPKTSEASYWSGDLPWISASSLKSFLIGDSERRLTAIGASSGTKVVPPGTTICIVRGMSLKTEFRMGITTREVAFGQDCKAFIPRGHITPHVFAYSLWNNQTNVLKLVDEAGHGTGRLDSELLGAIQLAIPSKERIGPLEERLAQLTRLGEIRRQESMRLGRLRDTLLPKLMSGQVGTSDAEKVVEDPV